ncbi:MAG: hypothetical protein IJY33_04580, partial [Oscillospiraceae bacterium]|nr:hypothetical protein [Oscillospiraceae bacterium]
MKKIKLTNPILCQLVLYLPLLIICLMVILLLSLETAVSVIIGVVFLLFGIVYLLCTAAILFSCEITLTIIENWKKDRLWFSQTQTSDQIIARANGFGKPFAEFSASQAPLLVQNKKTYSKTVLWSSIIRTVVVYKAENLDELTYRKIFASAKQIETQTYSPHKRSIFMTKDENKAPVCHATALIILADRADEVVTASIRKLPDFEDSALIPCIVDLSQKRVYFDGLKDPTVSGMLGSSSKNFAIRLIKKIVFGGRLPLKNNDQFDYSRIDKELLEKSLYDFVVEMRAEFKDLKNESQKIAKNMVYDEIKIHEDSLYIKHGERVAEFTVLRDESEQDIGIICDEFWIYPKKQKISNKDKKELKERITNYYA